MTKIKAKGMISMNNFKMETIMKKTYTITNFAKRLVMMLAIGLLAVNAWGAGEPTVSDLNFGTPTKTENFNGVTAVSRSTAANPAASLSGYGNFDYWYNNDGGNNTYAVKTSASPFTSNYLEIYQNTTKHISLFIDGITATQGAWKATISKTSKVNIGLYAAVSGEQISHANCNSIVQNDGSGTLK